MVRTSNILMRWWWWWWWWRCRLYIRVALLVGIALC